MSPSVAAVCYIAWPCMPAALDLGERQVGGIGWPGTGLIAGLATGALAAALNTVLPSLLATAIANDTPGLAAQTGGSTAAVVRAAGSPRRSSPRPSQPARATYGVHAQLSPPK